MKKLTLVSLIGIAMGVTASAQSTASGTLTINGAITGTMIFSLTSDAAGANLAGSGSGTATMSFGSVSAATANGPVAPGITKSSVGGGYQLSTIVDVACTSANGSSPSYNLSAAIDNTDQFGYVVNSVTMTTVPQQIGVAISYASPHQVPINVEIPYTATTTSVIRVVIFTATAN